MIFGSGIDIIEVDRMREAADRWGDEFLKRIFTAREIEYSKSHRFSYQHFAGRFAAKEAVVKAFGEPNKFPFKWTEVEVLNDEEGKPIMLFHGSALSLKRMHKIGKVLLSISHTKEYAVAQVLLMGEG